MGETGRVLLEVTVTDRRDVVGSLEGGADRLRLVATDDAGAVAPEPAAVSAVVRASDVPVRVALAHPARAALDQASLHRLAELGGEYLALGAEGVEVGFLDADLEVDTAACRSLLALLPPGTPWTFSRVLDDTLDPVRSWGRVVDLPGLTAVRSGGSPRGLAQGYDDLLALAQRSSDVARLLVASGGLSAEHVPWLVRAGVRQLHVGRQVRPGATYRSYVDADFVRSWRRLADEAASAAARGEGA